MGRSCCQAHLMNRGQNGASCNGELSVLQRIALPESSQMAPSTPLHTALCSSGSESVAGSVPYQLGL